MQELGIERPIRERVTELTEALYRVTAIMPVDEPLVKKIRETAVEILATVIDFLAAGKKKSVADIAEIRIEAMHEYLKLAASLQKINPLNFSVLEREYAVLAGLFKQEMDEKKEEEAKTQSREKEEMAPALLRAPVMQEPDGVNERQKAILIHIRQTQQAKISDFAVLLNGISIKTIQRELQDLVEKNILRRQGERRWTVYVLNDVRYDR